VDAPRSLEDLFRVEYPRLVRALSVAAGSPEVAADAVQDAFVQASRHWGRICSYDDPAPWVRRVAVNWLADQRRLLRRRTAALARLGEPRAEEKPTDLDLAAAVRALPPRQRTAICLYYLADLPVSEVAQLMGVTAGTVKSHLADARGRLSHLLEVPIDER